MQKEIVKLIAYIFMLIFDFSMLAGTFYIVENYKWDDRWFILTIILIFGSSPTYYFKEAK